MSRAAVTRAVARVRSGELRSLVWFVVFGLINNLTAYALFAVLTLVGVEPLVSVTVTYLVGMTISFFGNRRVTFRHSGKAWPAALKFLLVNAVGYCLNFAIILVFVHRLHFPPLIVQAFAVVAVAVLTFFSMRLWVFKERVVDDE